LTTIYNAGNRGMDFILDAEVLSLKVYKWDHQFPLS